MASYLVDMSSSSHAPVFMEEVRARFSRDASCRSGQPALLVAAAAVTKSVVASSIEDKPMPSKRIPLLPAATATADLYSGYDNSYALMPASLPSNPSPMQGLLPEKGSGKKRERAKGSSSRGAAKRLKLDPEGAFETSLEPTADGAKEVEAQQKFQQQPPPPPPPAAKRRNRQRQKRPLATDEDAGEKAPPKRRNKPKVPCQFPNPSSLSQPLVPQPISAPNAQTKNYLDVYGLKVKVNKASDISKFIEDYTVEDLLMRNPKPLFSPFFVAEQGQSHDTFGYQIGEVLQLLPKQGSVTSSNMIEQKPPPLPPIKYTLDLESLPQPDDDFQNGPSDIDQYMSHSSSSYEFSAGSLPLYSFREFVKSVELPPSNSLEYLISKSDSTVPLSTANKLHPGANSFEENDGTVMRTWLRARTLTTEMVDGGDSLNGVCQWEANNKNRIATPIKGGKNPAPETDNRSVAVAFSCLDIDLNKESPPEEDNETNLECDSRIRQVFQSLPVDAKEEEEDTNDNDRWHGDRDSTPCKDGKEEPASSTRERKEDKSPRMEIQCDEGKKNNLENSSSVGKDLRPGHSVNGDENPSSIPVSGDHAEHPPPPPSGQDFCDDGPISPRVHAAAHLLWSFANSHCGKPSSTSHTRIQGAKKLEEERLLEISSLPSVPVPLPVPKRRASKKSRNSAPPLPLVVASPLGQERASSGISASTSNNNNNYEDELCTNNTNKIKRKKKEGRHNQNRNDEQENHQTLPDIASIPSKRTPDQTAVVSTTTTTDNNNTAKRQQQLPKTVRYHPQICSLRELDKAKTSNNNNNNNNNNLPPPSTAAPFTINGNVTTNATGSSSSRTHVIKIRPQSPPQNNNNSAGGSPGNSLRHTHPFFGVVSQRARN